MVLYGCVVQHVTPPGIQHTLIIKKKYIEVNVWWVTTCCMLYVAFTETLQGILTRYEERDEG